MPRKTPLRPTLNSARRQDDTLAALPATLETRLVGALTVPIAQLTPDPDQPRRDHGGESLVALADSLTAHGVLQPLLVRAQGTLVDGRTRYMIVAGGRRYAAALLAGLAHLPVVVRDTEGATLRLTQLIENIQRQDLAPLEEARAFQELMDAEGLKAPDLARRLHISAQTVRDRLLLLSDQPIADAVQRGQIGTAVARDILRTAPEPQAALRAMVDAGASVTQATVKDVRTRAEAAGVTNPRKTGGGRRKRSAAAAPGDEHNTYAPALVAVVRSLAAAVEAEELRAYIDARKAKDARYRIADDPNVAGFVAALTAMRRAVE